MSASEKSIRGTRTEKNILAAYLSESSAYTRYTFFAQQAVKESYYPVQEIFNATAQNELHHAKVFFRMLQGGQVEVPIETDAGVIGDTAYNLGIAVEEEQTEGVDQYTAAAAVATEEGFPEIASHFTAIASIEARHKKRFQKYLDMVKNGTLWKRAEPVTWQCLVCGYQYVGTEPPKVCPACDHPYQHYIALGDDLI
ncbi:MAG: rubrerythrin family protein [Bacteroidales bacterium]|nr:rubrerythrin family protein [Bacteroidales bacterium]MCD8385797.1 rubrerythrin family protein [Bacteroidales bacterium]